MLTDLLTALSESGIEKLKDADPAERKRLVRVAVCAMELGRVLLKESPELRRAFGAVHAEFLHYPECSALLAEGRRCLQRVWAGRQGGEGGMKEHQRKREEVYATDNVMSDGMNPPIAADELVNAKLRAAARAGRGADHAEPE